MILSSYLTASQLKKSFGDTRHYAKIIKGSKTNSIVCLVDVKTVNYSTHRYKVSIKGKRKFWINGSYLEYLLNYEGGTVLIRDSQPKCHHDTLGREIKLGSTLAFSKRFMCKNTLEPATLVIGTVIRQSSEGTLWVSPIKVGSLKDLSDEQQRPVKVQHPSRSLLLDSNTLTEVLLFKLCN